MRSEDLTGVGHGVLGRFLWAESEGEGLLTFGGTEGEFERVDGWDQGVFEAVLGSVFVEVVIFDAEESGPSEDVTVLEIPLSYLPITWHDLDLEPAVRGRGSWGRRCYTRRRNV